VLDLFVISAKAPYAPSSNIKDKATNRAWCGEPKPRRKSVSPGRTQVRLTTAGGTKRQGKVRWRALEAKSPEAKSLEAKSLEACRLMRCEASPKQAEGREQVHRRPSRERRNANLSV